MKYFTLLAMFFFFLPLYCFTESTIPIKPQEEKEPIISTKPQEKESITESQTLTSTSSDYTIIDEENDIPILSPTFSNQKTLKLQLANQLEILLISDPEASQSATALSVEVGHWDNPKENPGMAHFLEHMLFLGTEKFPAEDEYSNYIETFGGMTNAYTSTDHTNYAFSINHEGLKGALERFSLFFKAPLLNNSGIEREMHAVDQEFSRLANNDSSRISYIHKELENPNHPNHLFTCGNLKSLNTVSREVLVEFLESKYSANIMHLAVYSALPLEDLKNWTTEFFSGVPNKNRKITYPNEPLNTKTEEKTIVHIEPLKDERLLILRWELPEITENEIEKQLETQPDQLISYVLGHEGKTSLLTQLKRENLANQLMASGFEIGPKKNYLLLHIYLTSKGLEQYNLVIERTFQAIYDLKTKGIPLYLFEEIQKMQLLNYQYQNRTSPFETVTSHAANLIKEPLSSYPKKTKILQKFGKEEAQGIIEYLTPTNCLYSLAAPSSETNTKYDKKEQWIGTAYTVKSIPNQLIEQWETLSQHLNITIPKPNPLIPTKLALNKDKNNKSKELGKLEELEEEENSSINLNTNKEKQPFKLPSPELLFDGPWGRFYFSQDTRYLIPKVHWNLKIKTPSISESDVKSLILTDLYLMHLEEELNTFSYEATLAGLDYSINQKQDGLQLQISGYNENALLLLETLLNKFSGPFPTQEKFNEYHERLSRSYENFEKENSLVLGFESLKKIIYLDFTSSQEKAKEIAALSFNDYKNHVTTLFEQIFLEGLLYGNITKKEAQRVLFKLKKTIVGDLYPIETHFQKKVLSLQNTKAPLLIKEKKDSNGQAAILLVQGTPFSFKARAAHQILEQGISKPFFHNLRTLQQTGYVVGSYAQEIERQLYLFFYVLSHSYYPQNLLTRFELTLEDFIRELPKNISEDQFQKIQNSQITLLQNPPKNMGEMSNLLNLLAFEYNGDFTWLEKRIGGLKELTYKEFLEFSKNYLGKENPKRVAILFEGKKLNPAPLLYKEELLTKKIKKSLDYFSSKDLKVMDVTDPQSKEVQASVKN